MDIVVPGNSQLQWSIIRSDMPSALGLVHYEPDLRTFGHRGTPYLAPFAALDLDHSSVDLKLYC